MQAQAFSFENLEESGICGARVKVCDGEGALARTAAGIIRKEIQDGVRERGVFALMLSGGSTPQGTYAALAEMPDIPWDAVHIFFGDERMVPPGSERSNYRMAAETLITKSQVPARNVHRIRGEMPMAEDAAEAYEAELHRVARGAGLSRNAENVPVMDIVLLGMGADGHTASLFPEDGTKWFGGRLIVPTFAPRGAAIRERVSATYSLLAASRRIIFLVAGDAKLPILHEMADDAACAAEKYPAARVRSAGEMLWICSR